MVDIASYEMGRADGKATTKSDDGLGAGLYAQVQHEAETTRMRASILDLKQQLVGVRAVKDRLKDALKEVAPNHPLLNPGANNPDLIATLKTAAATITSPDDPV